MQISTLGSVAIGLTWGWLAATTGGRSPPSRASVLALVSATLLIALEVLLLARWGDVLAFLGATAGAVAGHVGWRHALLERFGPSAPGGGGGSPA